MTPRERLHGYDLDPHERRLLRAPPPRRAIAWCEEVTSGGCEGADASTNRSGAATL